MKKSGQLRTNFPLKKTQTVNLLIFSQDSGIFAAGPGGQSTSIISQTGSVTADITVDRKITDPSTRVSSRPMANARTLMPVGQAAIRTSTVRASALSPGINQPTPSTNSGKITSLAAVSVAMVPLR